MFHRMKGWYIHSDTLILQHNLVAKTYNVLSSASLQSLFQIALFVWRNYNWWTNVDIWWLWLLRTPVHVAPWCKIEIKELRFDNIYDVKSTVFVKPSATKLPCTRALQITTHFSENWSLIEVQNTRKLPRYNARKNDEIIRQREENVSQV